MAMQSPSGVLIFFDEIEKFLYDVFDAGLNKNAVLDNEVQDMEKTS